MVPHPGHKKFTEPIAITCFITLVPVRAKNIYSLAINFV